MTMLQLGLMGSINCQCPLTLKWEDMSAANRTQGSWVRNAMLPSGERERTDTLHVQLCNDAQSKQILKLRRFLHTIIFGTLGMNLA